MRASDHPLQQPLFVSKWQKVDKNYPYSVEGTGYTFAPVRQLDPYVASMPTSCQMKRPDRAS
jgi:branched-chain amino acid transport system substrate-binding protein